MIEEFIKEAMALPKLETSIIRAYKEKRKQLLKQVNETMFQNPRIFTLIGSEDAVDLMVKNHHNHAAFMSTVFSLGDYELLARTLPWVYRAYHNHHFSYDYFPVELEAWIQACNQRLREENPEKLLEIYSWMKKHHGLIIALAESPPKDSAEHPETLELQEKLLDHLLNGELANARALCKRLVVNFDSLKEVYTTVLSPLLHRIGRLWEVDEISVAQEHLATAQVVQIMTHLYSTLDLPEEFNGILVVSTAPHDHHEIGAWMIANTLESDGWNVHFLGSDTPKRDLLQYLKFTGAKGVVLSVTMSFNLESLREIVSAIRKDEDLKNLNILVGGYALDTNRELIGLLGEVHYADSLDGAVEIVREWK